MGILQGFIERVDGWSLQNKGRPMGAGMHAGVSLSMMAASLGLSTLGVIALVAGAYSVLSIMFLCTFTIPLFTLGLYRLRRPGKLPLE